jgi:hypothetical protein
MTNQGTVKLNEGFWFQVFKTILVNYLGKLIRGQPIIELNNQT